MKGYHKAGSYLYKLDPVNYKDIRHDAYLSFYKTTGENLFEQPEKLMIKVLKYTTFSFWRVKSRKTKIQLNTEGGEELAHVCELVTPFHQVIADELLNRYITLKNNLPDSRAVFTNNIRVLDQIMSYKLEGYNNKEIAEKLSVSKALVTYYLKQIDLESIKV
jgi:hypothetical protein